MNVLTWLRKHRIVFGTDIVKMFRQIRVHQDNSDLQRIFWINENQQQITYQLTTVNYGLNCSPWLSLRVLQQLKEDEGHHYPAAVATFTKGRYVDDIYGGADPEEELGISTSKAIIQFEKPITKVLGLYCHQSSDTFRFKSKQFESAIVTKRVVASEIAQVVDPLGFIAPLITRGKIIIQDLWKLKLTWNTPLPKESEDQWTSFRENLNQLNQVSVLRWLRLSSETSSIQIHGFADASTAAMSAVVYIRTKQINEPASTVMVCAKIKIAPLKRMTIPRLELTAALMLTQLVVVTQQMLELNAVDMYLWSDSSVALAWIKSHPSRWKDFVQNRVIKIQESLPNPTWRHISAEASAETRPTPSHQTFIKVNAVAELLNRYSTLAKFLQVTATLNRAIDTFRRQPVPQTPVLTSRELNEARLFWVKITQYQYLASVHRLLERDHQIPRRHPLAKLTPTPDNESIFRLGGRLKNFQLDPDEIHLIILPHQSRLIPLVIAEAHRRTLHGGTQLTLAHTRQKYWIIGGRCTVRAYISCCPAYIRHRGRQAQQLMGQLPAVRLSPSRAFLHTGVDYASPFPILKWRPTIAQPSSVHIAVFVCFSTSAVHLELVSRQTTDAFIGAYKRFTGRRGIPDVMYSDNATTFVGTSTVLNKMWSRECLQRYQAIYKWNQRRENIKVGDMVLMVDEDHPPAKWTIGRVVAVHPGEDGLARVAIIKTSRAVVLTRPDGTPNIQRITSSSITFIRPIIKLCLLPTDPPPAEHPPEDDPEPVNE
ncbi:uncharacterized protein LOC107046673 [Diachasma alloeum]|uniref:uncharacterized protein LOC107046673 n=1 Tax=Diachasma alloeum TaxID=454923 RepID=UPI0007382481|nr:uncharacterized protein LOC107046673 [Diachasma alloeum]